jgi:SagB-type dehydrogenase family enzyme
MGVLAIAHVAFNWNRLVSYARFRLTRRPHAATAVRSARPGPMVTPANPDAGGALRTWAGRLSRRSVLLAASAVGGWWIGRGLRPPPVIPKGSDVGVVYHQWSKPGVIDVLGSVASWGDQPPLYKRYPDAPAITLPEPSLDAGLTAEQAIVRRRSVRDYASESIALTDLSRVLHLTSGIVHDEWGQRHRTAPSSGALYPIELYPVVHRVEGLEPGVYHYSFERHALELLRAGDLREAVTRQGVTQEYLGECSVVLFLTMIMQRMRFRYQDRTYRYGLIEAGHIGQNLYLAATSMGLGACAIGAFMDDDINAMLGVDGVEEAAVYMLALGRPARAVA